MSYEGKAKVACASVALAERLSNLKTASTIKSYKSSAMTIGIVVRGEISEMLNYPFNSMAIIKLYHILDQLSAMCLSCIHIGLTRKNTTNGAGLLHINEYPSPQILKLRQQFHIHEWGHQIVFFVLFRLL